MFHGDVYAEWLSGHPEWHGDGVKLMKALPGIDIKDLTLAQLRFIRRARMMDYGRLEQSYRINTKTSEIFLALNDDANPPGWYYDEYDSLDDDIDALRAIAETERQRKFDLLGERK